MGPVRLGSPFRYTFRRKKFQPSGALKDPGASSQSPVGAAGARLAAWYRRQLDTNPFLTFGLPFVGTILAGSFFLTPATAVRYEKYDRKTHMLDRQDVLGFNKTKTDSKLQGRRDIREDYYRLAGRGERLDDWEPKRIKRLPGEPDGTFD